MTEPWEDPEGYVYTVDEDDPHAVLMDRIAGALFDIRAEFEEWEAEQRWSAPFLTKGTRDKYLRIAEDAWDAQIWTSFGLAPREV